MVERPPVRPAASYDEALARVQRFKMLDDASILPRAYTYLLDHGHRTPFAVVLLHGLTNHPGQYVEFAPLVHAAGHNVFVPRLPEQGDRNRMTTRLSKLTAEALVGSAGEALDIACGLGERVVMLGISTSGALCAYFAQYRSEVARAIPVNAAIALLKFPYAMSAWIGNALLKLPNIFVWWDPQHRGAQLPSTGYPRFPTHGLMQAMRVAEDVFARSRTQAPAAQSTVFVTNKLDPAVNNVVADAVAASWNRLRAGSAQTFEFTDLPVNHDIIDPENACPRTDIVYPKLLELIETTPR
ncbi:MAG: hypothetical protein JOZ38_03505 [Candidatus Eremiobacteraeota bacterium]|nr:hypothetical protein [Candidatus Eremiobacteraeota bacterium]